MNLTTLSEQAYHNARLHGFHPAQIVADVKERGQTVNTHYLATRIALCHSELSEALEELRRDPINKDAFAEELADAIIRIADLAHLAALDLEKAVEEKMTLNKGRPYQHGGRML